MTSLDIPCLQSVHWLVVLQSFLNALTIGNQIEACHTHIHVYVNIVRVRTVHKCCTYLRGERVLCVLQFNHAQVSRPSKYGSDVS